MFILGAHANTYLELGMPRTKKGRQPFFRSFILIQPGIIFRLRRWQKSQKIHVGLGSFIYFENEGFELVDFSSFEKKAVGLFFKWAMFIFTPSIFLPVAL